MKISSVLLLGLSAVSVEGLAFREPGVSRRALMEKLVVASSSAVVAATVVAPQEASAAESPVKREINSFIDLVYNFKNTALDGGLDASTLNEPSISFIDFGEKMKNGDVKFVEFIAPRGEIAYATIADGKKETRLRIGQGYPTGGRNSWSSPDYVIRSVSNFGVPYKFTVPALSKYRNKA